MKISTKCHGNSWYSWQTNLFVDVSCFHWNYTYYLPYSKCFSINSGTGYPIIEVSAATMFSRDTLGVNVKTYKSRR
jgi:hypothetical protein